MMCINMRESGHDAVCLNITRIFDMKVLHIFILLDEVEDRTFLYFDCEISMLLLILKVFIFI